jgi:ketosteroid isomerase-like protein
MHQRIAEYYPRIDRGDLDVLDELFAEDASYDRAGQRLSGLSEIVGFYDRDRKISGRHVVDQVWPCDGVTLVEGHFEGQGEDGSPRRVGFVDVWRHRDGKVVSRASYLSMGQDYVTR